MTVCPPRGTAQSRMRGERGLAIKKEGYFMKRTVSLALVLLLLLPAVGMAEQSAGLSPILGFGGEWASGSWGISQLPVSEEAIHVSCMFPRRSMHPESFDDMWWSKELLKRANVVFDWILVESSGFQEKKNLVLAAGDYPDIFIDGITKTDEQTFGPMGIFVNLTPYLEAHAPNTMELFERYPDVKKSLQYEDGAIYNLPDFSIVPRDQFVSAPYYNEAWLANLGMEPPSTLEELYDIFVAVRDLDADGDGGTEDEIPLLYLFDSSFDFKYAVLAAYGLIGLSDDQRVIADYVKDGQYLFVPVQEGYLNYLTYMKKLYDEGILSPECFTASGEQINARIQSLDVFMHSGTSYTIMPNEEDWRKENMLPFLTSAQSDEKVWPATLRHTRAWGNFVMTDKCQYPVEMIQLQDYFYTDVGSLMIRAGREADTYDAFGWKIIVDEATGEWTSEILYDKEHFDSYYNWRMNNSPLQGTYVAGEFHNKVMIASDYKNEWYSQTKLNTGRMDFATIPYPEVTYTQDEQDAMLVYVDIANYVKQMEVKFVTGAAPLSDWDSYVSTIYNMGLDQIIEVKQAAYDRWNQE